MNRRSLFVLALVAVCLPSFVRAANIEADPGKEYRIDKSRGPWMIMVATFTTSADPEPGQKTKAEAEKLAHELIIELRKAGMPAYLHQFDPGEEKTLTKDRFGRDEERFNRSHYISTCVLAGNYGGLDDKNAQDSLKWVKLYNPKCFKDQEVFRKTPGRPTPLSQAFLTTNPLLSVQELEEMKNQRLDPDLAVINQSERYSLLDNPGKYSLVVARFYGKQMIIENRQDNEQLLGKFLQENELQKAGKQASELATALRGNLDQEASNFNRVEAYVWHDYTESVVTVGAFDSPDDPAIKLLQQRFGPKPQDFGGGVTRVQPESFGVANYPKKGETRLWIFESEPVLMRVPKAKR